MSQNPPQGNETKKTQFHPGDLNPVERPFIRRSYDEDLTSGMETLVEAARSVFDYNVFESVSRPFRAIVLRDESNSLSIPIEARNRINSIVAAGSSDDVSGVPPNVKMVRCRIPEIHTSLPEPEDYLADESQPLIDLYPLFVGIVPEEEAEVQLTPGQIVEVDYGNLDNLSDPIFVRSLSAQTPSGGNKPNGPGNAPGSGGSTGTKAFANSCGGGYPSSHAPGAPLKHVPSPALGNVGPKIKPRYAPISPDSRRGQLPQGKGMFLLGFRGSTKRGKEFMLKRCQWAGLGFVCILSVSQKKGQKTQIKRPETNRKIGNYLASNGVQVFLWGFPHSTPKGHVPTADKPADYREHEFAKAMCEEAVACGASGVITDPEAGYFKGKGPRLSGYHNRAELAAQAVKHIQIMKQYADKYGLSLGITSYGGTPAALSKSFPFESFAAKDPSGKTYADFAIPQVYASRGNASNSWASDAGVKKSLKWWADTGFVNVIPALGSYGKNWQFDPGGQSKKSPSRMAMESLYPQDAIEQGKYGGTEDGTVMWWEWGLADDHLKVWGPRKRWDIIKSLGDTALAAAAEVAAEQSTARSDAPKEPEKSSPEGSSVSPPPAPKFLNEKDAEEMLQRAQSEFNKADADSKKDPPPHEFETALERAEFALQEAKKVLEKVKAGEKIPDKTMHVSAPVQPSAKSSSTCSATAGPAGGETAALGAAGNVTTKPKMKRVKIQLDRPRYGTRGAREGWCAETVRMREDVAGNLQQIVNIVHELGGVFISAGAGRGLGASKPKPGGGRVLTSFHYTNLAIDLHTVMACSANTAHTKPEIDEYVCTFDPVKRGTHGPLFIVWARSDKPPGTIVTRKGPDGKEIKFEVQRLTLPAIISNKTKGEKPYTKEITGNYFNLTAIMNSYGFRNIGGRKGWYKNSRGASEWWHFQADSEATGVIKNKTTFGDVLETMHEREVLLTKPVAEALNYIWVGTYFKKR